MATIRKGLGKGKGKGYKNIIGKDSSVHSQSARGMKQPQRMSCIFKTPKNNLFMRTRAIKGKFSNRELKNDMSSIVKINRELKAMGGKVDIQKDYIKGIDKPYGLSVGNFTYWYNTEFQRDSDLDLLNKLL